jgi:transitional endoplasmic reticulum ATPase
MSEQTGLDALTNVLTKLADSVGEKPKIDKEFKDVGIAVGKGNKITIPEGMSLEQAILWMERLQKEEETVVAIREEIDAYPLDGAYALAKTLKEIYGWTNLVPTRTFFGSQPPVMLSVETGPHTKEQVPWGVIKVPGIAGELKTEYALKDGRPIFVLGGTVRRKHEKHVHQLAQAVRETIKTDSIYKNKAIHINYRDENGERTEFSISKSPKFMDLTKTNEAELIFPTDTQKLVETNLFVLVEKSDVVRSAGVPLKRGVMLEGPYGTGKTLTAAVLAKKCMTHKWTFIYLDDVRDLDMAMHFARQYEPAVVFAEDLDRAVGEERTDDANRILNTLDGVSTKNNEIIVVLTTNEVMKIHKAMIRPGRIDAVIPVRTPDIGAIIKLVRLYGRDKKGNSFINATDIELEEAVAPLIGSNAAVIREAVEKAKLSSCLHNEDGSNLKILAGDIHSASLSMRAHLDLLKETKVVAEEDGATVFANSVANRLQQRGVVVKGNGNRTPAPAR